MSMWGNYPITEEYKQKVRDANEFCLSLSKTSCISFSAVRDLYYECKEDRELTGKVFDYWNKTSFRPSVLLDFGSM